MNKKSRNHRNRVQSRNNRIKAVEKKYRQIYGIKPGEIVTFKRSKAEGIENSTITASDHEKARRSIYEWSLRIDPSARLLNYYRDSLESKKGGFGMGRVISVLAEGVVRTVNLLTLDKKWKLSIEEKYVRGLEEEEDSLVSALDDIGQI